MLRWIVCAKSVGGEIITKLRKTKETVTKLKDKDGKLTGETKKSKTSYYEISINDTYIEKVGWSQGDELSIQPTQLEDGNCLVIRNITKTNISKMSYMTLK